MFSVKWKTIWNEKKHKKTILIQIKKRRDSICCTETSKYYEWTEFVGPKQLQTTTIYTKPTLTRASIWTTLCGEHVFHLKSGRHYYTTDSTLVHVYECQCMCCWQCAREFLYVLCVQWYENEEQESIQYMWICEYIRVY